MPTKEPITTMDNNTPQVSPGNYSPVTVTVSDSIGAIVLGTLSIILLIGWTRAEARYRAFLLQKEKINGSHHAESR